MMLASVAAASPSFSFFCGATYGTTEKQPVSQEHDHIPICWDQLEESSLLRSSRLISRLLAIIIQKYQPEMSVQGHRLLDSGE